MIKDRGAAGGLPDLHAHQLRHTFSHDWLVNGGFEGDLMRLGQDPRRSGSAPVRTLPCIPKASGATLTVLRVAGAANGEQLCGEFRGPTLRIFLQRLCRNPSALV